MIVHLLGLPGTGKLTVAHALASRAGDSGDRCVVVDNHLTSLPVLEVVGADGETPLADAVWGYVGEIREVVYRAIEELSPADTSFVFTNVLVESDPRSRSVITRLQQLATARSARYVAIMLTCDETQLRNRVLGLDRPARRKWVDPEAVARFGRDETLIRPVGEILDLDVTELSPDESATEILRFLK